MAAWLGFFAALLALCLAPGAAKAQVSFAPRSPAVINYGLGKGVSYSIMIANRASSERRVDLRLLPNDYPGEFALLRARFGGALPPPTLIGPGRVGPTSVGFFDTIGRCGQRLFHHGGELEDRVVTVWLPPNTTSTLVLPYALTDPPWPDSDYGLRGIATVADEPAPGQKQRLALRFPKPKIQGRTAVRIKMRVATPARLTRGKSLRISGRTLPRLNRKTLTIRYLRSARPGRIRTLGRTRTDRRGRFSAKLKWTAPSTGRHELWARYRGSPRGPFRDYTCAYNVIARR